MRMGPDDGCHDVPDPIAPIDMIFVSLEPTRIPMSLPLITISGPMLMGPIRPMSSIPFIPLIAPGEGLAPGTGMFISSFGCGEACEFGDADGICIPGMFISIFCGDADGDGLVCGVFIPGIFTRWGEGLGADDV